MSTAIVRIVVTDSNVLINLIHVSRLDFCGRLPGHEFVVPDYVREEINDPDQRLTLDAALNAGTLKLESITQLDDLAVFADLIVHIGRGEAACIGIASRKGWSIASDEKRRFRREALTRVGSQPLLAAKLGVVKFHSHPGGYPEFSDTDDVSDAICFSRCTVGAMTTLANSVISMSALRWLVPSSPTGVRFPRVCAARSWGSSHDSHRSSSDTAAAGGWLPPAIAMAMG